jgi:putative ABC transport system ATP-binding protein
MSDARAPTFRSLELRQAQVEVGPGVRPFNPVSLTVPIGRFIYLRGATGSGKSTLLRLLGGLQDPVQGALLVNGEDVSEWSFERFNPYRLRIGYGIEYGGLLMNRTLGENLMLPFFFHETLAEDAARERVADYAARFGLTDALGLRPAAASGSQRKACVVARALITHPELLILDNPLAGLAPPARASLQGLLAELRDRHGLRTVVVSESPLESFRSFDPVVLELRDRQLHECPDSPDFPDSPDSKEAA